MFTCFSRCDILVFAFCNTHEVYSYQRRYGLLPTECSEAESRELIMLLLTFICIVFVSDSFVINSYLIDVKGIIIAFVIGSYVRLYFCQCLSCGQVDRCKPFASKHTDGVALAKAKRGPTITRAFNASLTFVSADSRIIAQTESA